MKRPHAGDWLVLFISAMLLLGLMFGFFYQEKKHETYSDIAIGR